MRLSAVDCLERGAFHLWANWELVLFRWLASLLAGGLVGLGVLVPFVGLGLDLLRGFTRSPNSMGVEEWLELLLEHLTTPSLEWALAGGALLVFWGLAGCIYAYGEAGLYGVLYQADEAAERAGRIDRPAFRVISWRGFRGWGGRYFSRYFGLINLFGAILLAGFLPLLGGLLLVLAMAGQRSGVLLAGVGCVGVVIALAVSIAATLWYWLAEAELALPEATVSAAARQAVALLGHRLGAILLILLVGIAALCAVSVVTFPFSSLGALLLKGNFVTQTLFQLTCSLIQGLLATVPQIALAGALVSLVRSERTPPSPNPLPRDSEVPIP
jgi:hypothetical protein